MSAPIFTHQLVHPVEIKDDVITELRFRDIEWGDMKVVYKMRAEPMEMMEQLICRLTGQTSLVVNRLRKADIDAIQAKLLPFFDEDDAQSRGGSSGELVEPSTGSTGSS